MKYKYLILFFIVTALLGGASSALAASEKMTVVLDWFINPDHGPLFIALEKGFFKQQGLDVSFQVPSNPNDPPKLVAAKNADIAVSYQPQHYLHVDQGLPLVRIAPSLQPL
jgi:putative hydroxymethylpyrimidine transport system substrate-binding protein